LAHYLCRRRSWRRHGRLRSTCAKRLFGGIKIVKRSSVRLGGFNYFTGDESRDRLVDRRHRILLRERDTISDQRIPNVGGAETGIRAFFEHLCYGFRHPNNLISPRGGFVHKGGETLNSALQRRNLFVDSSSLFVEFFKAILRLFQPRFVV